MMQKMSIRLNRGLLVLGLLFVLTVSGLQAQLVRSGVNKQGFRNITEFGFLIPSDQSVLGYQLSTVNGWQFNPYFSAGLGVGLDIYGSDLVVPIFADARYYLFEESGTPFIYGQGGWSLGIEGLDGGPRAGFGAGFQYWASKGLAAQASLGYQMQFEPALVLTPNGIEESYRNISSFTLRVGFAF